MKRFPGRVLAAAAVLAVFAGCGEKAQKYDTNLLVNGSFEKAGPDGVPQGWKLVPFRGSEGQSPIRYGLDTVSVDGEKSFFFQADPGTRRFFMLQQEVPVAEGTTHVRVKGWLQTQDTQLMKDQFAQCNFLLTFYDAEHKRFQEMRAADKRTPLRAGTHAWMEESFTFRIPNGTRHVALSCILAMNGYAWFDNVSLEVPKPVAWETATTKNFLFHWLPGHPMPDGSREAQQQIFDYMAGKLGLESDVVVNYYFYPDTATIQNMLSVRGYQYVSWDDYEFHSINANDNHEVVHFMTDAIGRPPRAIAEGTVYWIQDEFEGYPLPEVLKLLVKAGAVPPLNVLFDYNQLVSADAKITMPISAAFVKFIVERWGTEKLMEFYRAINGVNTYDGVAAGFEKVYGLPLPDADRAWRTWLKVHYGKA